MAMTIEKEALLHFKHRHAFESTGFDPCEIVLFIRQSFNKSFAIRDKNLEAIIDRGWFHLDRRLLYVWQLGDSCHQNGCWKMATTVEKDALLHFKHRHTFESTDFDQCNIVSLINRHGRNPLQGGARTWKQSLTEGGSTWTGGY